MGRKKGNIRSGEVDEPVFSTDKAERRYTLKEAKGSRERLQGLNRQLEQEIQELKQAELTILKAREFADAIVVTVRQPLVVLDTELRVVFANESFYETFQVTPEVTERRLASNLGNRQWDVPGLRELLLDVIRDDKKFSDYEVAHDFEHIGRRVMLLNARVLRQKNVQDKLVLLTIEDITERKEAEERLRESEERYRTILDSIEDAYFETDLSGKLTFLNDALPKALGYSRDELLEMRNVDYMPPESAEKIDAARKQVYRTGFPVRKVKFEVIRKDGSRRFREMSVSLKQGKDGRPIGLRGISRDITEIMRAEEEKKKLETQLHHAQKMEAIGVLAGGVAHDFNNLLTTILGNVELALPELDKANPLYEDLLEIKKAGEKAAGLTRQILAFSRREARVPELLDLNETIGEVQKMLRRLLREDIELVVIPGPELWMVYMDPSQMDQIIMNLTVNASDAMPNGGTLTIETANVDLDPVNFREQDIENVSGPYVMLAVTDTGVGMDEDTRKKIFDPFFTTKERGTGTGLGLATVYGIVKQNKGFIWCYSEPGQGTTLKVYLPRFEAGLEPGRREEVQTDGLTGQETVLVVEDNDSVRNMAIRILSKYGYRTLEAAGGKQALDICRAFEGPVHLLITDVIMPGMNGKELSERLRSERPDLKVLFMSGYTQNIILQKGILPEDIDYIQKPFSLEALARKVRETMGD